MNLTGNEMFYGRSKMMKKVLVLMLVLGLASAANAALSLADDALEVEPGGTIGTAVLSDADGGYACWLELVDGVTYDAAFTEAGNPNGDSVINTYADYPGWYELIVASLNPSAPIVAGDHIAVTITAAADAQVGAQAMLNLYDDAAVTVLDSAGVTVVPEPATLMLLGLAGLFLRRRK